MYRFTAHVVFVRLSAGTATDLYKTRSNTLIVRRIISTTSLQFAVLLKATHFNEEGAPRGILGGSLAPIGVQHGWWCAAPVVVR